MYVPVIYEIYRVVLVLMTVAVLSYVCALDVLFDNRNPNRLLGRDFGQIRSRVGNNFFGTNSSVRTCNQKI